MRFLKNIVHSLIYSMIRNWPGPGSSRVHPIKLLRLLPRSAVVSAMGAKFDIDPADDVEYSILCNAGARNLKALELMKNHVPTGGTIMDVGSHVGLYALVGSTIVGSSGQVFAFEPIHTTFRRLVNNISLNNADNVIPINKALSDFEGPLYLNLSPDQNSGKTSISPVIVGESCRVISYSTTIKRMVEELGLRIIDFVKIDAQGAELHILKGAGKLLASGAIRNMYIELHTRQWADLGVETKEVV